jgi:hypothetical protein
MTGRGQDRRHRYSIRLGVLALAAASTAMLGLAPSAGAFAWQSPVTVSTASDQVSAIGAPRVATDSQGDLMVAWLSNATLDPTQSCPCVVRAAYRPAGGSFGAPVDVSPTIANPDDAMEVHLAMDAAGDAIVGYTAPSNPSDSGALPDTVYAAIRPAGGSFGAPQVIASPGGPDGALLDFVKMDAAGDAIAAVNNEQPYTGPGASSGDTVFDAQIVTRPAGGAFDATHPQILTSSTENGYPRALSMSSNGHAVIAVETTGQDETAPTGPEPNSVKVGTSSAPGVPFGPTPLATLETVTSPLNGDPSVHPETAATNDAGDYVVGWQTINADSTSDAKVSINGAAPAVINPSGDTSSALPRIVMNPSGEAVGTITDVNGNAWVTVRPAGGAFGPATQLHGFLFGTLANAANLPGANGDVIEVFDGTGHSSVEASIRPAGGSFPPPTQIAPDNDDPLAFGADAAIDPAGDAAVTWGGNNGAVRVAIGAVSSPTPPPPPVTPPKIGAPKLDKKHGTAKLPVTVSGAGKLVLTGKGIKKVTKAVAKPGKVTLLVKPTGALARKLKKSGRAKVKVKVTFTPTGGKAVSSTKALKLVEKRR